MDDFNEDPNIGVFRVDATHMAFAAQGKELFRGTQEEWVAFIERALAAEKVVEAARLLVLGTAIRTLAERLADHDNIR